MIRLSDINTSLKISLAGSETLNQAYIEVSYSDNSGTSYKGNSQESVTDDANDVTICDAPPNGVIRDIDTIQVYNYDAAPIVIFINKEKSGVDTLIISLTLQIGDQLSYTHAEAWKVIDKDGHIKTGVVGPAGPAVAFPLTIGFGLTGGSYDGSAPITIAADLAAISPLTTKGDLFTYSTVNTRLGVGTNGYILTADSATATGLKWAAAAVTLSLETDGVANGDQTLLNLISGTGITLTDDGLGGITIDASGGASGLPATLVIDNTTGLNDIILSDDGSINTSQKIKDAYSGGSFLQFVKSGAQSIAVLNAYVDLTLYANTGQITIDAFGDVTINSNASATFLQLSTASWTLQESGANTLSSSAGSLSYTGTVISTNGGFIGGQATAVNGYIQLYNSTNANYIKIQSGVSASNLTFTLPTTDSTGTQALVSNGSGVLGWASIGSGTVTNVSSADANITVANPTTTPILTLVQTPALKSATTTIDVSAATAPTSGQVLTATSGTAATWQTPSGGGGGSGTVTNVSSADANITVANPTTTPTLTLVQAPALKSATTTVDVSAATAPTVGQFLRAASGTTATWQSSVDQVTIRAVNTAHMIFSNIGAGFSASTVAIPLGSVYSYPIQIPQPITITDIVCNVTIAGSAGSVLRMAMYAASTGLTTMTGLPLFDSGDITAVGTGVKSAAVSATIQPGMYWLSIQTNSTTGITVTSIPAAAAWGVPPTSFSPSNSGNRHTQTITYAPFTTPTTSSTTVQSQVAMIGIKRN